MRVKEERFRSFSSLNCDQRGEFSRLICSRTQTEAAVCETQTPSDCLCNTAEKIN